MEREFVSYEQAVALKELGFDEPCYEYYDSHTKEICDIMKHIPAPLKQQVFRWFREKYEINGQQYIYQTIVGGYGLESIEEHDQVDGYFNTYEEAENACIDKLIKIAKQQDK